jgi:predicted RNA-binding Zn ribbon-like protein
MAQSYEGQPVRVTNRIGDKPAPGQLRIIQAFLNTANPKVGREDFISPEVLKSWLVENSLLAPGAHVTGVDVRETIAVRDALYRLLDVCHTGKADPDAVKTLNRALRSAQMSVLFDDQGRSHIEPLASAVDGALGRLIAIVHDAMADGTWTRLKICRSDDCAWAFYDRSKNHSGAWCSITDCGNVAKARAYRARHSHAHDQHPLQH